MLDLKFPYKLRVLAEYESSGIWRSGPNGVSEVKHEDLGLPPDLRGQFYKWIALYSRRLAEDDWNLDEFNARGRSIAKDLKVFMGPEIAVEYIPELPSGDEGPPETID